MISDKLTRQLAGIVGNNWVSFAEQDRRSYNDAYSPDLTGEPMAAGFVAPASVEEVQAVVRLANERHLSLWPVSTGRNIEVPTGISFS